jgi:hypothetical protein
LGDFFLHKITSQSKLVVNIHSFPNGFPLVVYVKLSSVFCSHTKSVMNIKKNRLKAFSRERNYNCTQNIEEDQCCGSGSDHFLISNPGSGYKHFLIPDLGSGSKHFSIPDPGFYMKSGLQTS